MKAQANSGHTKANFTFDVRWKMFGLLLIFLSEMSSKRDGNQKERSKVARLATVL